jgi:hypothetical protein
MKVLKEIGRFLFIFALVLFAMWLFIQVVRYFTRDIRIDL